MDLSEVEAPLAGLHVTDQLLIHGAFHAFGDIDLTKSSRLAELDEQVNEDLVTAIVDTHSG